jgi:hypothetical protein
MAQLLSCFVLCLKRAQASGIASGAALNGKASSMSASAACPRQQRAQPCAGPRAACAPQPSGPRWLQALDAAMESKDAGKPPSRDLREQKVRLLRALGWHHWQALAEADLAQSFPSDFAPL